MGVLTRLVLLSQRAAENALFSLTFHRYSAAGST